MGFVTLEFRKRHDAELCLKLDDVQAFSDKIESKMKINRVPRFIEQWNAILEKGENPLGHFMRGTHGAFQDGFG
jgi:Asp-tRNA(Asn)/Glu-tRNA(Gln) amidotransferase C subunit